MRPSTREIEQFRLILPPDEFAELMALIERFADAPGVDFRVSIAPSVARALAAAEQTVAELKRLATEAAATVRPKTRRGRGRGRAAS
jgi:hypothetical protein